MSAKIKLQRKGSKNKPFYRIVVQDERDAPRGRVIEVLGTYNPLVEPSLFNVDKEKLLAWMAQGAQPTEKLGILLSKAGVLPPIDLKALKQRPSKAKSEGGEAAPAAAPAEPAKKVETKEAPKEEVKAEAQVETKEEQK
ncbi:MAG: 30S ribosomal protein S16 [Candidatus Margulisiibacteriota bacterium]